MCCVQVGIDDALVMETKEEIFELNNGCVCCTGQDELAAPTTYCIIAREGVDVKQAAGGHGREAAAGDVRAAAVLVV